VRGERDGAARENPDDSVPDTTYVGRSIARGGGRMDRRAERAVVVVSALAIIAGCGGSGDDASARSEAEVTAPAEVDKAGNPIAGGGGPVTLTVAWYGGEGRPQAQVVERFAEEVADASGGEITIDIRYGLADAWQQYEAGAFDLLLTPTRALDTLGVGSFDVLSLPFLVSDDDQADRVAGSPAVDAMMAGLSEIGATGLMFAPVYAMHLAVADRPLRTIDQLETGVRVSPPGERTDEVYAWLGGHAVHGLEDGGWDAAVSAGDASAAEFPSSLATILPSRMLMASNFALYYEFVVLLAHDDVIDRLSSEQLDIVHQAATLAEQRSIDERVREGAASRDACAEGGHLTAAPMTLVADIGRAVDDHVLSVLADEATRELYDSVERAAGSRTMTWPQECLDGALVPYAPPAPPSSEFPTGVYRTPGRSREQMLVSGVTNDEATNNASEYIELMVSDGEARFEYHRSTDQANEFEQCSVPYTVDDVGRLVVEVGCGWEGTYTWHTTRDGIALELMPVSDQRYLTLDWDNSAILLSALISVS
jgi:TRAP-type C4-dicarboxylate transport system substrate-binding protein